MLNKHFLKRLFTFVVIIAIGAFITLVANYIQTTEDTPAAAEESLGG